MNPATIKMDKNFVTLKPCKLAKNKVVDYSTKTSTRKVFIKPLNIYTSNPLSAGNSKLDKTMLIFDLPAIASCLNCNTCKSTCYAMKSQRQYSGTYNRRAINFYLASYKQSILFDIITNQLKNTDKKICRIHSSGDFFSQSYIDLWTKIVQQFSDIQFYAYTKTDKILDFSRLETLKNFNLVKSILSDGSKNFGSLSDYRIAKKSNKTMVLCSYGIAKKSEPICGIDCKKCMKKEHVFFKIH